MCGDDAQRKKNEWHEKVESEINWEKDGYSQRIIITLYKNI